MPLSCSRSLSVLALTASWPAALLAQADSSSEPGTEFAEAVAEKRVFLPADFERFAPKTGFDMINQLPGFTLRFPDNERGLGQASENVLINGQRVTDKTGGAIDRLRNVPAADVVRIEVSEAAGLGIAGLTGQVANVILKENRTASGRFEWRPTFRPEFAKPSLLKGSVSYSGTQGPIDYTLSVQNVGGRGGAGGPDYLVLGPDGAVTEHRDQLLQFLYDDIRLSTLLKYGGSGPVQANLNLTYDPYWQRSVNAQRRIHTDDSSIDWLNRRSNPGFSYEVSGDLAFPLVGGTLKLIGLRRFEHSDAEVTQRSVFDNGHTDEGVRFSPDSRTGETIGRLEYSWKGGSNDWQLSLERAYNSLDQRVSLAVLDSDGEFEDVDFPGGNGIVTEKRYEAVLSLSRPLSGKLDLQLVGGGEYSRLKHVDRNEPEKKFFRPKGSVSLAWRPVKNWDASLKLERKVGQISFFDFLAQPDLVLDRENDANPDLVPPQSWELTGELGYNFGAWGKTRLRVYAHRIDDIVDFIPIGEDGEAVGNLPRASRFGVESKSTVQFDPIGWKGAKVDMTLGFEESSVEDPLTGTNRPISGTRDHWVDINLRHDIPNSLIAWGAYFNVDHFTSSYYLGEENRNWEGPYFGLFVEHKDLAGLKTSLNFFNITDARSHFYRTVHEGRRNSTPVAFSEVQNQRVSQIFTVTVSGTF